MDSVLIISVGRASLSPGRGLQVGRFCQPTRTAVTKAMGVVGRTDTRASCLAKQYQRSGCRNGRRPTMRYFATIFEWRRWDGMGAFSGNGAMMD